MNTSLPSMDTADEIPTSPLWLLTFANLTAILVALFVLMYSMSAPFSEKGSGTRIGGSTATVLSTTDNSVERYSARSDPLADLTVGYLSAVLSDRGIVPIVQNGGQVGPVTQSIEGDRLVLHIASDFAFSAGGKTLKPMALGLVSDLAVVLSNVANPVSVFAAVPENNWVLAFDRADGVVDAFRQFGYSDPIERFVTPGVAGDALVVVIGRARGAGS